MAKLHNWRKHYFQILHQKEDANKNILDLFLANYYALTVSNSIWNPAEDPDKVVISVAPVTGNIKILHSLQKLGGTR